MDDTDDHLGHEGEEECHEAEGAVSPAAEKMTLITWAEGEAFPCLQEPPELPSLNEYAIDRRHLKALRGKNGTVFT